MALAAPRDPSFNEADVSDKPSNIRDLPPLTAAQIGNVDAAYRARAESVLGVDDLVQNVVNTLQASGELKNTVLIFTSDNGFFHGEHRVPRGKVRLYEPSIRVPLLIRAPGMPKGVHREAARVQRRPGADHPRLRERHGRPPSGRRLPRSAHGEEGVTFRAAAWKSRLSSTLRTRQRTRRIRHSTTGACARTATCTRSTAAASRELYDLRSDPFELQNRAGNPVYAPTQGALRRLLSSQANCAGKTCRARPAVKLKARCSSAKVAGKGKPQEATFYLRGKKVRRDAKAADPGLAFPARAQAPSWRRWSTSLDGRIVS